jgi:hypothetical protein
LKRSYHEGFPAKGAVKVGLDDKVGEEEISKRMANIWINNLREGHHGWQIHWTKAVGVH